MLPMLAPFHSGLPRLQLWKRHYCGKITMGYPSRDVTVPACDVRHVGKMTGSADRQVLEFGYQGRAHGDTAAQRRLCNTRSCGCSDDRCRAVHLAGTTRSACPALAVGPE